VEIALRTEVEFNLTLSVLQKVSLDILAEIQPAITHQSIEVKSCSNPLRCRKSCIFDLKNREVLDLSFL